MTKKQHFHLSLLVVLIFPLTPLIVELINRQTILDTTLVLTTCLYVVTVLTTSKNIVWVIGSVFPAILLATLYSETMDREIIDAKTGKLSIYEGGKCIYECKDPIQVVHHEFWVILISALIITVVAIIHGLERRKRHMLLGEKFFILEKEKQE